MRFPARVSRSKSSGAEGRQAECQLRWPGAPRIAQPAAPGSREPCGRWYVSFALDVDDLERLPATGAVVGVDLGIKSFAVTSDGEKAANPRKLARRAHALARYQRRLARCQKGSANRRKAKAKAARAHRKVRASRPWPLSRHTAGTLGRWSARRRLRMPAGCSRNG